MKKTIYPAFFLSYIILGMIGFFILCTQGANTLQNYLEHTEAKALYKEATLIASDYAVSYYTNNITLAEFEERLSALDNYMDTEIWVMNTSGELLINSAYKIDLLNLETIPEFDALSFGNTYYTIGDFYGHYQEDKLTVFAPISIDYKVQAYILIHMPYRTITNKQNHILTIFYHLYFVIFLLGFIVIGFVTIRIIRPMKKITTAANAYASGDFSHSIDVHSNDELGYLAASLSYMANELNTLEEDQRKFVSNVSHDFRSPLTSIKGYVEAILDGTIPVEIQDKYLNIILFETERLTKLTNSLLELNHIGKRGTYLDISNFDINQVVKMTATSFEGRCKEKHISFELILTGQTLFVRADMSKIQQVIHNLIDNAIKFSNNDSIIKIETTLKNEKVFVSVKDSGIGIPKESITKIWERFYKTDLSRGKDKKGTGLGLAIVKEIINAHNENISVISTEGVGTEFIFSLPHYHKEDE